MTKTVINVWGMSCLHCVRAVTNAVSALDGVADVNVVLEDGTAAVEYDSEKVTLEQIKTAIAEEGYKV